MLQSRVSRCISAVGDWMFSNRLLMNTSQDGGSVVHVWPSSASAANSPSGSWQSHRATCQRSPESWHLCRCWPLNAHTRQQHPRGMLCLVLSLLPPHQCYSSEVDSRVETELFARSYQQFYWICLCITHCDSTFLFRDQKSLDLRHVNDDSNTN